MQKYYRSLIRTENLKTGKFTYFMVVCDVPRRISKEDFETYIAESNTLECLSSESTKTHRRQYTTCVYYVPEKVLN